MNIVGMDKAAIVLALYRASKPMGIGIALDITSRTLTMQEVREALASGVTYFDYVRGRVMKIDVSDDDLDLRLYDRDNGEGAGAPALRAAGLLVDA